MRAKEGIHNIKGMRGGVIRNTCLQKVEGAGLAAVAGEGCGAGGVDAVHPVLQLHLARSLKVEQLGTVSKIICVLFVENSTKAEL